MRVELRRSARGGGLESARPDPPETEGHIVAGEVVAPAAGWSLMRRQPLACGRGCSPRASAQSPEVRGQR